MSCNTSYTLRRRCHEGPHCVEGPPGPPGLPCDLDWGVAVMDYIRPSVVGIATHDGVILGRGFWVSDTVVATAWSTIDGIEREALGLRILVDVAWDATYLTPGGSQALPLDGVLIYAVPLLGVAFVAVNPTLVAGTGYTPRVLGIRANARAGERVVTTAAPGTFVTGFVTNASVGSQGYITDVTTSLAPPDVTDLIGAPIIHAYNFTIIGMVQYVKDGSPSGVCGALLASAIAVAAGVTPCVLQRAYVPGPATIPGLGNATALGKLLSTTLGGPYIAAPLITEAVRPQLLSFPFADTATGAWIYSPDLVNDDAFGTALDTVPGPDPALVFGTANSLQWQDGVDLLNIGVDYARASVSGSFVDISSLAGVVLLNTAFTPDLYCDVLSELPANANVRVSVNPVNPLSSQLLCQASNIYVSALGFIVFATSEFPVTVATDLKPARLTELINDPDAVYVDKILYAAPFGCEDFLDTTVSPVDTTMLVYFYDDGTSFIVQWSGYALSTGDPVSFQVRVTYTIFNLLVAPTACGEVSFAYAVTSGAWAGKKWLTATTLTSDPDTHELNLIRVVSMPCPNDLIYFGNASYSDTLYMPARQGINAVVCPQRRTTGDARGTVAAIRVDGRCCYAAAAYTWPGFLAPLRVVKVNTSLIGAVGVNNVSLPVALVGIAPTVTEAYPVPVLVYAEVVSQAAGSALEYATTTLVRSAVGLGTVSPVFNWTFPTADSIRFAPGASQGVYQSVLLTLPTFSGPYGSAVQNNFTTATVSISITATDLLVGIDVLFIVQLAATNSTTLDTQFQKDALAPLGSCVVIYGHSSTGYFSQMRAGYGGGDIGLPVPLTLVSGGIQVTRALTYYAPGALQRINAMVIGRPPRSGNDPMNDPTPVTYVLATGTVLVDGNATKTGPLSSAMTDMGPGYVITTQHGIERPYPY